MTFLNRTMEIFGASAANASDEVCPVVAGCFARRSRLDLIREPGLVGIVSIDCQVTVRSVEDIADGVGFSVFRAQNLLILVLLAQACGWNAIDAIGVPPDLGLMIGDPMSHFELHHLSFAMRLPEGECGVQRVGVSWSSSNMKSPPMAET